MKLRILGQNQTEIEADGAVVLYSYSTPVAAQLGSNFFRTDKKYSSTTNKHINLWLAGKQATERPQAFFDSLLTVYVEKAGAK